MNASEFDLKRLIGKEVKATRDFSGIKAGTRGKVVEGYSIGPKHHGIMVEWTTEGGYKVRDGFGRDTDFDETQWLEVVGGE